MLRLGTNFSKELRTVNGDEDDISDIALAKEFVDLLKRMVNSQRKNVDPTDFKVN